MVISRKRCLPLPDHPLLLCSNPLVCVDEFKYLCVLLHTRLSWSLHVDVICSKARHILGLLFMVLAVLLHSFDCIHL